MKILVDINHPAHVHLFKNFAIIMQKKGHEILFTAREKEVAVDLLRGLKFNHVSFGKHYKGFLSKLAGLIKFDYLLIKTARKFKPDIFLSMASIYGAHASFFLRTPHIAFEDSEPVPEHQMLYVPFTEKILTPQGLKKNFGKKHERYNGFHELAYLHPDYFKADKGVLEKCTLQEGDKFAILRFVSFKASHDVGIKGFSEKDKIYIAEELSRYGKVFISSENPLNPELEPYRIELAPNELQSLLSFASLFFGDSQTMATEAAVLGIPAVRCNSFADSNREMSNFIELEKKYNLLFNYNHKDKKKAIKKALELFKEDKQKDVHEKYKNILIDSKIDVTAYMVDYVENYYKMIRQA